MKTLITELVANKPKHYVKMIKNDPAMLAWVNANTLVHGDNTAEMIYSAVTQQSNYCANGKLKKFRSFSDGYRGCGPANVCACTARQVSRAVSVTKQATSTDVVQQSNEKRRVTVLAKYGVECVAQLPENVQKFKDFYADPVKVAKLTASITNTYVEQYGVTNCRFIPEVEANRIATILTKYNVTNISQIPATKAKLAARMSDYKITGYLIQKGYVKFAKYITERYDFTLLTPLDEYRGTDVTQVLEFACNKCATKLTKKFYYGRGLNCEHCNPTPIKYISSEEQSVYDFVTNELGVRGYQSDRTIIQPYELDMVFPDHKIAIEYGGLYWHCEISAGRGKAYHQHKMQLAKAAGYHLLTIFSDELLKNPEIVKSKLRNIFKQTPTRHYARKLQVRELSSIDSKPFLDKHHLQGHCAAQLVLGLYTCTDVLVALMSFSNGRKALNTASCPTEYELVRFVTNGDSVVGGASKLLTHFIKHYNPTKITSYADLRWSTGALYRTLGFEQNTPPSIGYWYVSDYACREHRYNFTKNQLVQTGADPSKTEWHIMQELGYDRIWDCGLFKYQYEA